MVDTAYIKRNSSAESGHLLYLTKPIGTGIYATALKRGQLEEADKEELTMQLCKLNSIGMVLGGVGSVMAMTDITGFGLLGHLMEMCNAANIGAELYYDAIPLMKNLRHYLTLKAIPDATFRNWNAYSSQTGFDKGVKVMEAFNVLPDPQTNGGLLIAAHPDQKGEVENILKQNGLADFAHPIGRFTTKADKTIKVKPAAN